MTSAYSINRFTVVADAARSARVRLRLTGELDCDETERVCSAVAGAIERWAPAHVALDATGLTFLDSAGIRALLECRELAERAGAGLSVEGVSPIVHQVLSITELLDHLGVTVTAPTEVL